MDTYQNLWATAKVVLKGKFTAINTNVQNAERSQIKQPITATPGIEKQEQS